MDGWMDAYSTWMLDKADSEFQWIVKQRVCDTYGLSDFIIPWVPLTTPDGNVTSADV